MIFLSNSPTFKPQLIIDYIKKNGIEMHVNKNEFIFHSGDLTNYIYVIESGEVLVLRIQDDGSENAIHFLNNDCIFGAVTLYCGPKRHTSFAKSKTEVVLHKIEKNKFEEKVLNDSQFTKEWMRWLEIERLRHSSKLRDMLMYGKMGALASVIVRLSNSFGVSTKKGIVIDTKLTNQELAMLAGTSREVVNRYLKELSKEGIIEVNRKIITVKHMKKLKHIINCENCDINLCQIY